MKLLLHNLLKCRKASCVGGGYPLQIVSAEETIEGEIPYDEKYLSKMMESR